MRVRAALALGTLALLAACNNDPGPTPPPITPSTTAPTVSTSTPTLPPTATEHTIEGGKTFIRAWVDAVNVGIMTGN
ncbi:MAG: hypothetical protein QM655_13525 [Nocardioidaceae bacterium]